MSEQQFIEYVALDALIPAELNPKGHDIGAIIVSMRRFGFVAPAVMNEASGRIVVGHGRAEALATMRDGGEAAPDRITVTDDGQWLLPVVRGVSFATDDDAAAYLVADNRLTELGGWDDAMLLTLLGGIKDTELVAATGFDGDDLDAMAAALGGNIPIDDVEFGDGDQNLKTIFVTVTECDYDECLILIRKVLKDVDGTKVV